MKPNLWVCALVAVTACRADVPRALASAAPDTIRTIVDSVFPVGEEIRRFKLVHQLVDARDLEDAASTRDQVVSRFLRALETRDTTELRALTLDAAQFIDLYYPTSMYSHPPYKQSPKVVWLMQLQNSDAGLQRALARFGGQKARTHRYSCKADPRIEGPNTFWDECAITFNAKTLILFGPIIERNGRFKILTYANRL